MVVGRRLFDTIVVLSVEVPLMKVETRNSPEPQDSHGSLYCSAYARPEEASEVTEVVWLFRLGAKQTKKLSSGHRSFRLPGQERNIEEENYYSTVGVCHHDRAEKQVDSCKELAIVN
jgi:hypothetical protein